MKIVSFVANKGGVGKTTLAYQFGNYLAKEKDKNVLFLDFDNQRSLSSMYDTDDQLNEYTVGNILIGDREFVSAIKVDKNISLITSTVDLGNNVLQEISSKINKELLLLIWLIDNKKELSQYDYIIIDCNPAWNLITMNVVAASDIIISPMEPSGFGYESHRKVISGINELKKALINPLTKDEYVVADTYFIGNRIKHNTASSREFLTRIQKFDDVIGIINEKEVVNSAMLDKQYIKDFIENNNKTQSEKKFLKQLFNVFDSIIEVAEKK